MATVTMSLADVDNLRDIIKEKELKVSELEKEIQQVKSEKRVLKITKVTEKSKHYIIDEMINAARDIRDVAVERFLYGYQHGTIGSRYNSYGYSYSGIPRYIPSENVSEEYINFEDVKEKLEEEIKQKVDEKTMAELGELRIFRQNILKEQETYKAKVLKEKEEMLELHRNELKELRKNYDQLNQEHEDLKNNKVRISKEQALQKQINDLAKELQEEKNKKWYQKLWS